MPSGRRVFEQRVSPSIGYRELAASFHSWEGADEVKGLYFAQEADSRTFLDAVQKAAKGGTHVLFVPVNARSAHNSPTTHTHTTHCHCRGACH